MKRSSGEKNDGNDDPALRRVVNGKDRRRLLLQPPNAGQRIVGALRCQTAQQAGRLWILSFPLPERLVSDARNPVLHAGMIGILTL